MYGILAFLYVGERPLYTDVHSLANSFVRLDISKSGMVLAYMEASTPYWSIFRLNSLIMQIIVNFKKRCYKDKPRRQFLTVREF